MLIDIFVDLYYIKYIGVVNKIFMLYDGSSYYYDFDAQVEDAYEMFTRIGQMD